ncbi:MAG: hypothetical protein CVU18_15175 [Betaproteobacteria bacterium HGW-Betaproteobacteria-12]|nr:MAG: hypothetical protein CVU18_15175 [Betaproteobacteria bacterium HGW-Betaproteobacteria-12]
MKPSLISRLSLATALLFAGHAALAHDDATLDKIKAPNGGQLRMAGQYHFELLVDKNNKEAKDSPVTVYLTDHGEKKIPAVGASGTATILAGKSKVTVPLAPAGDNKLTGFGKYVSDAHMKVIVSIVFPDKKTEQARFSPLAAIPVEEHKH